MTQTCRCFLWAVGGWATSLAGYWCSHHGEPDLSAVSFTLGMHCLFRTCALVR